MANLPTPVVALSGGVGAARFLRGLVEVVPAAEITAIVNTGDDHLFYGVHVSPDLDIVTYTLAGQRRSGSRGFGLAGDSFGADRGAGPDSATKPGSASETATSLPASIAALRLAEPGRGSPRSRVGRCPLAASVSSYADPAHVGGALPHLRRAARADDACISRNTWCGTAPRDDGREVSISDSGAPRRSRHPGVLEAIHDGRGHPLLPQQPRRFHRIPSWPFQGIREAIRAAGECASVWPSRRSSVAHR